MRIIKGARGNLTGHFGDTGVPGAHVPKHLGMDIGHGNMTPADLRVGAPAPGIITAAGQSGTYGNRIIINHGRDDDGVLWETLLAHLSAFTQTSGPVDYDTHIATMGNTGGSWPVHLHQELRRNGIPVDPEDHLTAAAGGGNETPLEDDMYTDADRARDDLTNKAVGRIEEHAWSIHKTIDELRYVIIGNTSGTVAINAKLADIDSGVDKLVAQLPD